MEAMGLAKSFQARLMDPEFEYMRLSATLKDSVYDMLDLRYKFLSNLDDVVRGPPSHSLTRKSSRLKVDDSFSTTSAPDILSEGSNSANGRHFFTPTTTRLRGLSRYSNTGSTQQSATSGCSLR